MTFEWVGGSTTLFLGLKVGWYSGEILGTDVLPISSPELRVGGLQASQGRSEAAKGW